MFGFGSGRDSAVADDGATISVIPRIDIVHEQKKSAST
jgi:hypothetical protein